MKHIIAGFFFLLLCKGLLAQAPAAPAAGGSLDGKAIYQQNCASCHALDKKLTGPALRGFQNRGPWADREQLHAWVHNPSSFAQKDPYAKALVAEYGVIMQAFPNLTGEQIDAIAAYVASAPDPAAAAAGKAAGPDDSGNNTLIYGVLSIVLAIIALILMQVNSNLKRLADEKEAVRPVARVPWYRNKMYITLFSILLFILGGYLVAKGAITLGRQKDYQPTQPIYYSHKVHAGINQINCLYCHGNAWESKHASIPSITVCMNCHKGINEYVKGPKLYNEKGEEIDGTAEIQKLYKYAGFEEGKPWDPSMAKPVEWIKIHNLPDHVYFNHAQHVNAGQVACQSCHGNIQEMDEVKQVAELSMGWCINCHRETKVNFYNAADSSGNRFYSIYEKFHNDLKAGKMDSVTVESIGGTECQKCHY